MNDSFEQIVIARLDDLKSDVNRASDHHDAGLKKLFEIHEAHAADDTRRFEDINQQFATAAISAAEVKGAAIQKAKMWGAVIGLPTPVATAVWALFRYFHH